MSDAGGSATVQRRRWEAAPRDWAEYQEVAALALYQAVLADVAPDESSTVLDVGCGSGLFASLAADRGSRVTGLDASPPLLAIARERIPTATFVEGEMEELPFAGSTFSLVTLLNSLHFAAHPERAVRDAARVATAGGQIVIGTWDTSGAAHAAAYVEALRQFIPSGDAAPLTLSASGSVERLLSGTGLESGEWRVVDCPFIYRDEEEALRGLMSAGLAQEAVEHAGDPEEVRAAVAQAIAPFRNVFGGVRMENRFRYVVISL